jgi:DNA polymerase-3 subunit beta
VEKSLNIGETMKISCKRENLAKALNIVSRMVRARATLPVLSNILIASDNGRLKLAATDLEAAVCIWTGAKIDEEGAITVPARILVDYITSNNDETVRLEASTTDILIKSEHYKATIKGIAAEEFPIIPKISGTKPIKVKAADLKDAIFSTVFSAAMDETRPVLAGVLLRIKGNDLKVVATDSYRLAEYSIKLDEAQQPFEAIVPQRALAELGRILPQDDKIVEIVSAEGQTKFQFDDIQFVSRQIEGTFPDYEQIIPKNFVYEFTAPKSAFEEALKTANIFARDAGSNIKLKTGDKVIEISAISAQVGDAEATLPVDSKGGNLEVAFNAKYILDGVNVIESPEVSFGLSGQLEAGLIQSAEKKNLIYLVMPLRNE